MKLKNIGNPAAISLHKFDWPNLDSQIFGRINLNIQDISYLADVRQPNVPCQFTNPHQYERF